MATVQRDRGKLKHSLTNIEAALDIIEDLRTKIDSQTLRTAFFASKQEYYEFYIDLLMQLHHQHPSRGYDALALQASERARARSLLELLAEAKADIRQGINPQLLQQERDLQAQLEGLEKRRTRLLRSDATPAEKNELEREISTSLRQYQQIRAQIRLKSPRYAALTQPRPLTLAEIQTQVLDRSTVLLEYALGSKRSYLWAVTHEKIASYELPPRAEIEPLVREFRKTITDGLASPKKILQVSAPLSKILLSPVTSQFRQQRLLVVSDGALQYIPFAALSLPDRAETQGYRPLMVEREIVHLPSASTLAVLRAETSNRQPAAKTLAILADPVFSHDDARVRQGAIATPTTTPPEPQQLASTNRAASLTWSRLPGTRQEALAIGKLLPESAEQLHAFDFQANRDNATNAALAQYRIIHFATHAFINSDYPELSGVVMSLVDQAGRPQNGILRLHDIYNLNLPAELVVLSACQTGLGKEIRGEGLVGLTRGFMYAGSPRVVTSLWNVSDEGTAALMQKFYHSMFRAGLPPAAALRAAQLTLWKQGHWAAPYYWAAFTLQGEWR